jgi:amidohydrolase
MQRAVDFDVDKLVARRRHLHAHPELAFEEHLTQQFVLQELAAMGLHGRPIARTGVICRVGPPSGPAIALRADMDGLPVQETSERAYKSQKPNVMHACGHDGHTACLLTVAETIAKWPLARGVVLLFQPAEEGMHGAREMVAEGCMADVTHVFGAHLWTTLPVGTIAVSTGPVMANSDRFYATVKGRGGHGSMPQDARDPILAAAAVVMQAQQIVSRNTNPATPSVVSFGGINSSSTVPNVIPETVSLCGTCRTYSADVRANFETRLREVCAGVAMSNQVEIDFDFKRGYDAVINDEEATGMLRVAAEKVAKVEPASVVLGGEDFFYYRQTGASACFCFVGAAIGDGVLRAHHSPAFDFDEQALPVSVRLYLQIVQDLCSKK